MEWQYTNTEERKIPQGLSSINEKKQNKKNKNKNKNKKF